MDHREFEGVSISVVHGNPLSLITGRDVVNSPKIAASFSDNPGYENTVSRLWQTHWMGPDTMSGVPDKTSSMVRGGCDYRFGCLLRKFCNPGKSRLTNYFARTTIW